MQHTKNYIVGFVLSIACTLAAYYVVVSGTMTSWLITATIVVLAVAQLVIQLVCFLHVNFKTNNRMIAYIISASVAVVLILIFGTIWIMNNLKYNMHDHPGDKEQYIIQDELIKQ